MEMRVRADIDIDIGDDITPPIPPLVFSLYDAFLLSHCSACFSPLHIPTFSINSHCIPSSPSIPSPFLYYCSPHCSNADSHLHLSSAEHHLFLLLRSDTSTWHGGDSSDLRTALRLLFHFENLGLLSPHRTQFLARIGGLMSNLDKLTTRQNPKDDEILARIRDGGKAMAIARRRMRGGGADFSGDTVLEEAVLCQVLTNAVEVQVNGGHALGIAVYDSTFSWINHSCSPNACYRFSLSALLPETSHCSDESRLRIIPATDRVGNGDETEIENGGCSISKLNKGCQGYGPRIIVRSIKAIKKGEEVSIAYTDLLQPTAIRQSELWLKYRFICCCGRCSALPPTYVDHALQEISAANLDCTNRSSDHNFYRDKAIRKLTDYIDDVITEYLSGGNPESCCEKLENMLTQGHPDEQLEPKDGKSQPNIRLHPLHSLALNAYTTLASAYKIRASHLLTLHPELNDHQLEAFDMSRTSAAYSLLLAGATHHLFLSEYSLIASVANFWTSAGESLLSLARSSVWNLFVNWGLPVINISSLPSHKCCSCSLMDKFEANSLCCRAQNSEFEDITREFLDCITNITPEVWRVLIHGCHYLKVFKDPIDFRWLGTKKNFNIWDFQAHLGGTDVGSYCGTEGCVSRCVARRCSNQEMINLFQLGFHCLLYGWFLSSICYGQHSHLTCSIQNLFIW